MRRTPGGQGRISIYLLTLAVLASATEMPDGDSALDGCQVKARPGRGCRGIGKSPGKDSAWRRSAAGVQPRDTLQGIHQIVKIQALADKRGVYIHQEVGRIAIEQNNADLLEHGHDALWAKHPEARKCVGSPDKLKKYAEQNPEFYYDVGQELFHTRSDAWMNLAPKDPVATLLIQRLRKALPYVATAGISGAIGFGAGTEKRPVQGSVGTAGDEIRSTLEILEACMGNPATEVSPGELSRRLMEFQQQRGLSSTGELDAQTAALLERCLTSAETDR